jgi:hypothetical protein
MMPAARFCDNSRLRMACQRRECLWLIFSFAASSTWRQSQTKEIQYRTGYSLYTVCGICLAALICRMIPCPLLLQQRQWRDTFQCCAEWLQHIRVSV